MREVIKTLVVILAVLLMLILANTLVKLLGEVASGDISLRLMGIYVGLRVIKLAGYITPPAFFFAILWVVGQMYRNSEMAALQAAGVGTRRLYRPFVAVALVLATGVGAVSLHLYPLAKSHVQEMAERERHSVRFAGLRAGGFTEFDGGRFLVYVGEIEGERRLRRLFVRYERDDREGLVLAASARVEQSDEGRFLVLESGHRYDGMPGEAGFTVARFEHYGIRMPDARTLFRASSVEMMPLALLLAGDSPKMRAELQWRLATPLSVFALMLVSVPLARSLPRQGVHGRLVLAVVFYAVYLNLLRLAKEWMERGMVPPWAGIWWVPASAVGVAVLLLVWDSPRFQRVWRRLRRGTA